MPRLQWSNQMDCWPARSLFGRESLIEIYAFRTCTMRVGQRETGSAAIKKSLFVTEFTCMHVCLPALPNDWTTDKFKLKTDLYGSFLASLLGSCLGLGSGWWWARASLNMHVLLSGDSLALSFFWAQSVARKRVCIRAQRSIANASVFSLEKRRTEGFTSVPVWFFFRVKPNRNQCIIK